MEVGDVLDDRYELGALVGEGAASSVWEARDRATGETVAIKVVSLEEAGWRAEVRDRFQQEARLLSMVQHEHLVQVRTMGETDEGSLYLVLERLHGESLGERLARPPRLSWREAASLAREMASGLAALHARGIVHRDLKPGNVILDRGPPGGPPRAPVAKIIDLGISKVRAAAIDPALFATLTASGQILGTPQYMSYEQATGARDIDARTDVWSLGVVLYEMLAGQRPYDGANVNAVLAAIRKGPPGALRESGVPAALATVVERCLSRDRAGRYPNGQALAEALDAAVTQGEAEQRVRSRALWVAGALTAVIAAGVAALLMWR
ncbi:MAG: serine/threonine-protein kinase [Byssovorax sp.]